MTIQVTHKPNGSSCLNLSKSSLENLDAILSVPDLDPNSVSPLWISPDLSHSLFQKGSKLIPTSFSKRNPCLAQSNSRQLIEDESAEEVANPIEQPKALSSKRPYALFLEDSVDQPSSSTAPKRYRRESVDNFVTQWVESVSGSESYREHHSRSDSLLNQSDGGLISRRLTKSVPNMANNRDVFKKPTTPASATSRSIVPSVRPYDTASSTTDTGSQSKSMVQDPEYREINLAWNNIFMRERWEPFPEQVGSLIDYVRRDRDSPEPTPESVWRDSDLVLLTKGAPEDTVKAYFRDRVFPPLSGTTVVSDNLPMMKQAVPNIHDKFKISNPQPDLLYGYGRLNTFPQRELQLRTMGYELSANISRLIYPFLLIELKGDSPNKTGSLWAATNQCLGGAASCVKLAERINDRLRQYKSDGIQPINSAIFSVAMNGTEARLYISWKQDELTYYLQDVDSFLLQRPNDYLQFRKYVRNIFDWGNNRRLVEIRDSLDKLEQLEESRKRASEVAKSRPSPSDDDSASDSSRKRRAMGL
ncbi:hypothetical protein MMC07_000607 [Pseudocyphellaria aurata]|nr:hypothetical protein [Pseudocyphellaria aurata]